MSIHISHSANPAILPSQLEQICYIEAYGNYVKVHTIDKDVIVKRTTLKAMLSELPAEFFCRVHNRHIVNLNQIQSIHKVHHSSMRLTLKLEPLTQLQVSRSYLTPFRKYYNKFMLYDIPFAKNDPGYCF